MIPSGSHPRAVIPEFPETCLQYYCDPWWVEAQDRQLRRGRLIWAFLAHIDQQPYRLVPESRSKSTEHGSAEFRMEALLGQAISTGPRLPVAGLPQYEGEVYLVQRAKRRPALVLSTGGDDVPKSVRTGSARHQTNPTILVAPYYGVDASGSSGGWRPDFVERIRRCEYPQYMWDRLPFGSRKESVLRLDHLQPIGKYGKSFEVSDYELDREALLVVDEYLRWLLLGGFPGGDSVLGDIRDTFLKTS